MKVILKQDVKNLGQVGELLNVSNGYARNFLFPKNLAIQATEKRMKEFEHLKRMAEARKKKAHAQREKMLEELAGVRVVFHLTAGEEDKLFGAVTNMDISNELEKKGYSIDKRNIQIPQPIKTLGQHKVLIHLGQGLEQEIPITVERS